MTSPTRLTQEAVANVLLDDAGVVSVVAQTPDGPAVFARNQTWADAYPRITLRPPQRVDRSTSAGVAADMFVTLDAWAKGDDAPLVAGEVADAAIKALAGATLVGGWTISSRALIASRPVGDPDPTIEHFVIEYRLTVHAAG